MTSFDDFLDRAAAHRRNGEPFVVATVVRVERPSSGRPGDKGLVTADGQIHGWVGGACAEPTVLAEAAKALASGSCRLLRLGMPPAGDEAEGLSKAELVELPMTCYSGGAMEIFLEPHVAQPHLIVFGATPVGRALVEVARLLGYRTTLVDLGERDTEGVTTSNVLTEVADIPPRDEAPTFAVVTTHGTFDDEALEAALALELDYVGLVTSRKRLEAVRDELRLRGVDEGRLAAIKGPAGLDIGAQAPEEIAVSIAAELIAELSKRRAADTLESGEEKAAAGTATDPVCGMEVQIEGARHVHELEGRRYYFCCSGCKTRFADSPVTFLAAGST